MSLEFCFWKARQTAAYAALIDRPDRELGRVFANLEQTGEPDTR